MKKLNKYIEFVLTIVLPALALTALFIYTVMNKITLKLNIWH